MVNCPAPTSLLPLLSRLGPLRARLSDDRPAALVALAAALVTGTFFALARYPIVYGTVRAPLDITPGPVAVALSVLAPLPAALAAALAVLEPWAGLLAVLLLAPWFDAAQVGWWIGPLQVLGATMCVGALLAGVALRARRPAGRAAFARRVAEHRWAFAVGLALLVLASFSTLASPAPGTSGPVWLHGVVEPLVLALLALLLVPDLRGLIRGALALALSAALGGIINLVQTLPTVASPLALQGHDREIFARLVYFNVGLFGEVLAMAVPILVAGLAARRSLGLSSRATFTLGAALVVSLACLYLTFSKSGWLATGAALLVLLLALSRSRRLRVGIVVAAFVGSVLTIPWPLPLLGALTPGVANAYQGFMVRLWGADRLASWDPSTSTGEVSITERIYASEAALRMAADHPLLGVGLDRFLTEYGGPYRVPQAKVVLDSAHDLLPNLAAELGIPFAALVAAAMAAGLLAAWRTLRDPVDELARLTAGGVGAAVIGWWVVSATFDPDLYRIWRLMASDIVFAAVLVALAVALPSFGERRSVRSARR